MVIAHASAGASEALEQGSPMQAVLDLPGAPENTGRLILGRPYSLPKRYTITRKRGLLWVINDVSEPSLRCPPPDLGHQTWRRKSTTGYLLSIAGFLSSSMELSRLNHWPAGTILDKPLCHIVEARCYDCEMRTT
jgi:hypothetical protein